MQRAPVMTMLAGGGDIAAGRPAPSPRMEAGSKAGTSDKQLPQKVFTFEEKVGFILQLMARKDRVVQEVKSRVASGKGIVIENKASFSPEVLAAALKKREASEASSDGRGEREASEVASEGRGGGGATPSGLKRPRTRADLEEASRANK